MWSSCADLRSLCLVAGVKTGRNLNGDRQVLPLVSWYVSRALQLIFRDSSGRLGWFRDHHPSGSAGSCLTSTIGVGFKRKQPVEQQDWKWYSKPMLGDVGLGNGKRSGQCCLNFIDFFLYGRLLFLYDVLYFLAGTKPASEWDCSALATCSPGVARQCCSVQCRLTSALLNNKAELSQSSSARNRSFRKTVCI